MKPVILIIGIILLLIAGYALFGMSDSYHSANSCINERGYGQCEGATTSAGASAILGSPIFIICGMVGLVLVGDGLI
jgi:hypothetical protein